MLRLALTRRWLGYLALTITFSIVASFFGIWQWDRREQAVSAIAKVDANYDQLPVPVSRFLGNNEGFSVDDEWLPVTFAGTYRSEDQVLVRTRPRAGQVGFEILVPLQLDQGIAVVVNRGWVPTGEARDFPDQIPPPPAGEVTVVGRLKPPEPTLRGRGAPQGQLSSIDIETYQRVVDQPLETSFYVQLVSEDPPAEVSAFPALKPVPNEGPHLSYTLQWFVFVLLAVAAYGWLLRAEYRVLHGITPPRRGKASDAEEEDALLV